MTRQAAKLAVTKLANNLFERRIVAQLSYDAIDLAVLQLQEVLADVPQDLRQTVAAKLLEIAACRTQEQHLQQAV